jgi:hypothetical protein
VPLGQIVQVVRPPAQAGGQGEPDSGLDAVTLAATGAAPLPITSSQMSHLWQALGTGYNVLGFERAVGGDDLFPSWCCADHRADQQHDAWGY